VSSALWTNGRSHQASEDDSSLLCRHPLDLPTRDWRKDLCWLVALSLNPACLCCRSSLRTRNSPTTLLHQYAVVGGLLALPTTERIESAGLRENLLHWQILPRPSFLARNKHHTTRGWAKFWRVDVASKPFDSSHLNPFRHAEGVRSRRHDCSDRNARRRGRRRRRF
jgi:hypothetical protein